MRRLAVLGTGLALLGLALAPASAAGLIEIAEHSEISASIPDAEVRSGGFTGPFDGAAAMKALYGNFDMMTDRAVWAPGDVLGHIVCTFRPGARLTAKPVLAETRKHQGREIGVLVAEANPDGYYCPYAHMVTGIAVFEWDGEQWRLRSGNRAADLSNVKNTVPPRLHVFDDGTAGVELRSIVSRQGIDDTALTLIREVDGRLAAVLLLRSVDLANPGDCIPSDPEQPCWGYRSTLTPTADGFILRTEGTEKNYNTGKPSRIKAVQRLRFDGHRYRAVP